MQEHEPELNVNKDESPVKSYKRNGTGIVMLATLALLIAVTALPFQFFFWQLHKKTQANLLSQNKSFHLELEKSLQKLTARSEQQQSLINNLVATTGEESKRRSIFLAEEAKHLVISSQYSLLFDRNYELGLKELILADQKLQGLNDASLNTLRQELNNAIVSLNTMPKVDVAGIAMRISALSDQVAGLSALPVLSTQTKVAPTKPKKTTWQERLWSTLESLRGIISIRRTTEPLKPLPSAEQQLYLIETIRLQLSQAQWAVLHQEPDLYQSALSNAKKDLQRYYAMNPTGASIINMINELQQQNIKPNLPDVTNIIAQLQQYIDSNSQSIATPKPEEQQQAPKPLAPAVPAPTTQPSQVPSGGQQTNVPTNPSIPASGPALPLPATGTAFPRALSV